MMIPCRFVQVQKGKDPEAVSKPLLVGQCIEVILCENDEGRKAWVR